MASVTTTTPPLGFPKCPTCPYLTSGPPAVCFACARRSIDAVSIPACVTCNQRVEEKETCRNPLCHTTARRISYIRAVGYLTGELHDKIIRYKYDGKVGWSLIFARLVVGYLDAYPPFANVDLIVANPTYPPGQLGHTERVLRDAATEDLLSRWPFDIGSPTAIIKTADTERSAGKTLAGKATAAEDLRKVLAVPEPSKTAGKHILVYDDVCTTGHQLDAVAQVLIEQGGATDVRALVLARAPWR